MKKKPFKQLKLQTKEEVSNFVNFVNNDDFYSVVRILNARQLIIKDYRKTKEFKNHSDAVLYFNKIKNDIVKDYEVLTAIFKGSQIDDKFWKINDCRKIEQLKLKI